jgi:diguanylate cyclase (GGDEF)-like protein
MRLMSLNSLRILDTQPEERFDRITRMGRHLFGVDICLVSLVDADRQWFKSRQGLDACETSREISFCGHAILAEHVFVIKDATQDPRFADNPLVTGEPRIRFYAGCPIHGPGGQRIGTLCLIHPEPRQFSDTDEQMLRDLAALVDDELALLAQSATDELTGVSNRLGFNTVSRHILSLCQRTGTRAGLVYFDLDGFKAFNDDFGHQAGDEMLKHFARALTKCFRATDVIGRLGGDEFVVLMPDTDCADAALARLDEHLAAGAEALAGPLRWSAGCVSYDPRRHLTIESLLADADERMYENKVQRRRQRQAGAASPSGGL